VLAHFGSDVTGVIRKSGNDGESLKQHSLVILERSAFTVLRADGPNRLLRANADKIAALSQEHILLQCRCHADAHHLGTGRAAFVVSIIVP
jgi:hypothetical protein